MPGYLSHKIWKPMYIFIAHWTKLCLKLTSYTKPIFKTKGKTNTISLLFPADKTFEKSRFLQSEQDFGDVWDVGTPHLPASLPSASYSTLGSSILHWHPSGRSCAGGWFNTRLGQAMHDASSICSPRSRTHLSAHFLTSSPWWLCCSLPAAALSLTSGPINHRDTDLHKQTCLWLLNVENLTQPEADPLWGRPSRYVKNTGSGWKKHQERRTEWSREGKGYLHWPSRPALGFLRQEH